MVHHVVEINADAETVRRLHQPQEIGLRAVKRADRPFLVLAAEIKRIKQVIAHRQPAACLGRRWNPEGIVTGFRQFWHLGRDLVPTRVEVFEHGLRPQPGDTGHADEENQGKQRQARTRGLHAKRGDKGRQNGPMGGCLKYHNVGVSKAKVLRGCWTVKHSSLRLAMPP